MEPDVPISFGVPVSIELETRGTASVSKIGFLWLVLPWVFLSACTVHHVKKDKLSRVDSATNDGTPASLFSRWKQDNTTFFMDFSTGSCSAPFSFEYETPNSSVCKCMLDCSGGTSSSGKAKISQCAYEKGSGSTDEDPGCETLNAPYGYTNNGTMLYFTNLDSGVMTTYHESSPENSQRK